MRNARPSFLSLFVVLSAILAQAAAAQQTAPPKKAKPAVKIPAVKIEVSTDRSDALYKMGEPVRFNVSVTQSGKPVTQGKIRFVLDNDGPKKLGSGTVVLDDKPIVIEGKMDEPGFLRCQITFKQDKHKITALATAGISPEKIQPSAPAPDDFDDFWAKQKAELAKVPMNAKLTPVKSPEPSVECFDVKVDCLGGAPVSGYLARPKGAKPKSLPVILWVHGAGVYTSNLERPASVAAKGILSMDLNAHGILNGQPAEYYTNLAGGRLKNYRLAGREDRQTCYFLGMYLRLVRAIDFLCAQPEWDGQTVIVIGHSQGGGQALVAGGLDSRVTCIGAGVPAMCDHTGMLAGRVAGWPRLVPQSKDGKPDPQVLETTRYFDAVNFAARCKADAIMSVGFVDFVCPPSTNYTAYNQLRGKKRVLNFPQMGHRITQPIQDAFLKWALDHIAARKTGTADKTPTGK